MPFYVIKGHYHATEPSVIVPASDGTPIPIGRARNDGLDVRIAPLYVLVQSWLNIPPDLAADLGAVEVVRETLNPATEELSDGFVTPENATLIGGKYVCAAINKRVPEDGKTDATNGQVTAGSAAIIAAMVAEKQAEVVADYADRVRQALFTSGKKLTTAQRNALQSGALAALQTAKLAP
jgi:hypothetical protein